ncbi:DUF2726 domain-containing protein [Vibrio sp. SCSIO 43136]|uniref:DUF2726 domain-containing protein n=1 Tax=Vibrio sp. SCSIO 43136 TaxID=2819101 RepID=UPI0020752D95|nr:DUF2726 domain-containing protein [Vibrio sp. SCSIO 43136]USD63955.1 DUF2726 domain-containing protein [Vibrio sp. SCSIO 43136]
MQSVIILLVVLVTVFVIYMRYFSKRYEPVTYRYKKVDHLMTQQESAFYNALISALDNKALVFPKMHMADVITPPPSKDKKKWVAAFNKIARKHLDFVIVRPGTLDVLCIIEFDNGAPLDKTKADREKLIMHVCKTSGIPLVGANAKYSYQVARLRRVLAEYIPELNIEPEVRFCKECGSPMVLRFATQGEYKGRRYFTCSRAPTCRYTEDFNEENEINWS